MSLPLKDFPRSGEDVAQRQKGDKVSPKVTERAHPAPPRGAAAAAAEGPSNRRSAKNAFSEAASIFPLRPLLWDYQGRVALDSWIQRVEIAGAFLVLFCASKENKLRPAAAYRNRCDLAALNTRHLLRKPVCGLKAPLGLSCPPGTAVLSGSLLVPKENNPRPAAARRNRCALAALNTRHLLCKPVCGLKAPLGLSCPPGTAVLSGSLLSVKREHLRPAKHHPKCTLIANQKCRLFAFQCEKLHFYFLPGNFAKSLDNGLSACYSEHMNRCSYIDVKEMSQ